MNKILNIKKNKVIRENLSYQNFININFMRKTIIIIYIISFFFHFFKVILQMYFCCSINTLK